MSGHLAYFTTPVEIYRAPLVKDTYARARDWDNAVLVWSGLGCPQPDKTWETRSPERDTTQERLSLWLPPSATNLDSTDRAWIRDMWWELDGEPQKWLYTPLPHVRVRVWRVEK